MENVRRTLTGSEWGGFWYDLGLELLQCADVGLDPAAPDSVVWRYCQQESLVLVTANRNCDDADSLEATIAAENTPDCLPVVTIGDHEALRTNRECVRRVAVRILEILYDIDRLRGSGRAYVP